MKLPIFLAIFGLAVASGFADFSRSGFLADSEGQGLTTLNVHGSVAQGVNGEPQPIVDDANSIPFRTPAPAGDSSCHQRWERSDMEGAWIGKYLELDPNTGSRVERCNATLLVRGNSAIIQFFDCANGEPMDQVLAFDFGPAQRFRLLTPDNPMEGMYSRTNDGFSDILTVYVHNSTDFTADSAQSQLVLRPSRAQALHGTWSTQRMKQDPSGVIECGVTVSFTNGTFIFFQTCVNRATRTSFAEMNIGVLQAVDPTHFVLWSNRRNDTDGRRTQVVEYGLFSIENGSLRGQVNKDTFPTAFNESETMTFTPRAETLYSGVWTGITYINGGVFDNNGQPFRNRGACHTSLSAWGDMYIALHYDCMMGDMPWAKQDGAPNLSAGRVLEISPAGRAVAGRWMEVAPRPGQNVFAYTVFDPEHNSLRFSTQGSYPPHSLTDFQGLVDLRCYNMDAASRPVPPTSAFPADDRAPKFDPSVADPELITSVFPVVQSPVCSSWAAYGPEGSWMGDLFEAEQPGAPLTKRCDAMVWVRGNSVLHQVYNCNMTTNRPDNDLAPFEIVSNGVMRVYGRTPDTVAFVLGGTQAEPTLTLYVNPNTTNVPTETNFKSKLVLRPSPASPVDGVWTRLDIRPEGSSKFVCNETLVIQKGTTISFVTCIEPGTGLSAGHLEVGRLMVTDAAAGHFIFGNMGKDQQGNDVERQSYGLYEIVNGKLHADMSDMAYPTSFNESTSVWLAPRGSSQLNGFWTGALTWLEGPDNRGVVHPVACRNSFSVFGDAWISISFACQKDGQPAPEMGGKYGGRFLTSDGQSPAAIRLMHSADRTAGMHFFSLAQFGTANGVPTLSLTTSFDFYPQAPGVGFTVSNLKCGVSEVPLPSTRVEPGRRLGGNSTNPKDTVPPVRPADAGAPGGCAFYGKTEIEGVWNGVINMGQGRGCDVALMIRGNMFFYTSRNCVNGANPDYNFGSVSVNSTTKKLTVQFNEKSDPPQTIDYTVTATTLALSGANPEGPFSLDLVRAEATVADGFWSLDFNRDGCTAQLAVQYGMTIMVSVCYSPGRVDTETEIGVLQPAPGGMNGASRFRYFTYPDMAQKYLVFVPGADGTARASASRMGFDDMLLGAVNMRNIGTTVLNGAWSGSIRMSLQQDGSQLTCDIAAAFMGEIYVSQLFNCKDRGTPVDTRAVYIGRSLELDSTNRRARLVDANTESGHSSWSLYTMTGTTRADTSLTLYISGEGTYPANTNEGSYDTLVSLQCYTFPGDNGGSDGSSTGNGGSSGGDGSNSGSRLAAGIAFLVAYVVAMVL